MKKALFSKVTDADRQCVFIAKNAFGQICVDIARRARNTREAALLLRHRVTHRCSRDSGRGSSNQPTEEQRRFKDPQILSVSRGVGGSDRFELLSKCAEETNDAVHGSK